MMCEFVPLRTANPGRLAATPGGLGSGSPRPGPCAAKAARRLPRPHRRSRGRRARSRSSQPGGLAPLDGRLRGGVLHDDVVREDPRRGDWRRGSPTRRWPRACSAPGRLRCSTTRSSGRRCRATAPARSALRVSPHPLGQGLRAARRGEGRPPSDLLRRARGRPDRREGKLGDELLDSVVITTGESTYRRADGIAVVPAALLGP